LDYRNGDSCYANIGIVKDENGVTVTGFPSDGCLYTCAVARFPENDFGLYDMSGNVSEWVFDAPYDSTPNLLDQVKVHFEPNREGDIERMEYFSLRQKHNEKLLSRPNLKLVKGGSWSDGLAYLRNGSRQILPKDTKSCRVGFRVAATIKSGDVLKYLDKKNRNQ